MKLLAFLIACLFANVASAGFIPACEPCVPCEPCVIDCEPCLIDLDKPLFECKGFVPEFMTYDFSVGPPPFLPLDPPCVTVQPPFRCGWTPPGWTPPHGPPHECLPEDPPPTSPVPEPSSIALFGLGFLTLLGFYFARGRE